MRLRATSTLAIAFLAGCASNDTSRYANTIDHPPSVLQTERNVEKQIIELASAQDDKSNNSVQPIEVLAPEDKGDTGKIPATGDTDAIVTTPAAKLLLPEVIESIHASFPLVEAAYLENQIAIGNQLSAQGGFDTKLKASSENGPTGFYQTYRNSAGVSQPLFNGGEVFGGYRIGRGDFQPWYQERQTNDGGEFKIGASLPFARDRDIDSRRAELWRANYDQQIAQPEIRGQLIGFTRDASVVYWKWVAEGQKYFAERDWLELAASRNKQVKRRVEEGDLDPPELTDNERAIAKRKSKLADQLRKVRQTAVKLSLFARDAAGAPIVATLDQIPDFPTPSKIDESLVDTDIATALRNRPDLQLLKLRQQRLRIDYREACNLSRPMLDGVLSASQDVGEPTSKKRDKSEFELEAGIFFDVPVQRRKALGKMQAIEAKLAQVAAKERYTTDKVTAGVRAAVVGLKQAFEQVEQAQRAVELANQMAEIERKRFDVGESDLLKVALREQYAIEAIEGEVNALLNYFTAYSEYLAELAYDRPVSRELVTPAN